MTIAIILVAVLIFIVLGFVFNKALDDECERVTNIRLQKQERIQEDFDRMAKDLLDIQTKIDSLALNRLLKQKENKDNAWQQILGKIFGRLKKQLPMLM